MGLSIKELLRIAPNKKNSALQNRCLDLLGDELYRVLFFDGDTVATLSKIRSGYPEMNRRYRNAAIFLNSEDRLVKTAEHIKAWWMSRPVLGGAGEIRTILESDADFHSIPQNSSLSRIKDWLNYTLSHYHKSIEPDLMTVLSLLAVTHSEWEMISEKISLPPVSDLRENLISQESKNCKHSGLAFFRQKRYDEAIYYFDLALLQNPSCQEELIWNTDIHFWKSAALRGKWEREGLSDLLKKALDELEIAGNAEHNEAQLEIAKLCLEADNLPIRKLKPYWQRPFGIQLCHELIDSLASEPIRGEAYWLLYKSCMDSASLLGASETEKAEIYLKSSYRCGFPPEAMALYRRKFPIPVLSYSSRSNDSETGICITNEQNHFSQILTKTAPDGWLFFSFSDIQEQADLFSGNKSIKYMLLSDSAERNIKDLLQILQQILDGKISGEVEVYIRGFEDQLAPLVDTALHHMGDRWIPVHILDDDKISAQTLLGRHPLIYPVYQSDSRNQTLHFLIAGDNRCCQWMIREALWMMTLREKSINTRITLIGPHAEEALENLYFLCPGLQQEKISQSDLSFPEISASNCPVSYYTLSRIVSDAVRDHQALYLAVDIGTDIENLNLAVRLREETVRAHNWAARETLNLPVIAFRCRDSELAAIGKTSVVVNENNGLGWYNNYRLIPFGMDSRYFWDELTDNIFDKISWCFHLTYSEFNPEDMNNPDKQKELSVAKQEYYTRSYNRDSSMSAALSLPYRLLLCRYGNLSKHILEKWNIQDSELFFSRDTLLSFARELDGEPQSEEALQPWGETQLLTEWEHERWCNYLISRGWVSASPEEAEAYCKAGNPRQQLYIARMHPCLTPYSKLENLEKHLRATVGLDKNFRKSSRLSIENTENILRLKWLTDQSL